MIYLSKSLKKHTYSKSVYESLGKLSSQIAITITELEGDNIWCRDYLPVKGANGTYVDFVYRPKYLRDTISGNKQIGEAAIALDDWKEKTVIQPENSDLLLDGGSIEVCGTKCLVSTRILEDNPQKSIREITEELKRKLELETVFFIPQHPYDVTGHADGLVRFVDEHTVLINDLTQERKDSLTEIKTYRGKLVHYWIEAFLAALQNARLDTIPFSYEAHRNSGQNAYGVYMNFLRLNGHIFMPTFNGTSDGKAKEILTEVYRCKVHTIHGTELATQGGIINCVTWQH